MANNDKISKVYDALVKSGYNMAPEDVFRQRMNDPAKRRAAYDALRKSGYNMRPYDEFEVNIGYGKAGSSAPATPASTPTSAASATTKAATAPASPTDAPEQPDSSAPQGGWQPTAKEKAAISFRLHTLTNDFNERSRERVEQTRRMSEGFSPEGREKQRAARTRAQIAGTPMQVAGVTPDVQAESNEQTSSATAPDRTGAIGRIAHAAEETARRMTDAVKRKKSGQSPLPYGVVIENGERKTQWLLPDGSLTTDIVEADRAEYGARRVRLMHQFVGRMKENGLNPAKLEDVQKQAQLDYEAPMRKVLNSVWAQAEEEDRAADEEYRREMEVYNKTVRSNVRVFGPDGMPLPTSEENPRDFNRAVKRKETFNLESMANTILNNLPASYRLQTLHAYHQYFTAHTDELNGRSVHQAAVDALRSEVYNAVYQRAVDSRMPKSKMEFLIRKIADQPLISPYQAMEMGASSMANSWGMNLAELDAMGQYGSQHRALDITGSVLNMAIDPTTYISGGFGSLVGKQGIKIAGKQMIKGATKEVAERYAARTLTGRVIGGAAGGAANFATFEALKNVQNQMAVGGVVNPETGEREFSFGEVLKAGGHGLILGGVTGSLSPIIGNVADKYVKATSSTGGKMLIRSGELVTSTLAEGTIFSAYDIYENSKLADDDPNKRTNFDIWSDSMAMMLGFKVSHMVKSAPQYVASLRPIKPTDGRPLTQAERRHNRMNFEERLRKRMDGSPRDFDFTKEEREELRRAGYGKLADLFTRREKGKGATPDVKPEDGAIDFPIAEAQEVDKRPEFDGYDAMERLVQDSKVSQAVRAKAYYILTGRMLPMGSIMAYTTQQAEDGRFIVNSVTADGEVVTSRVFANEAKAQNEINNIKRQAELNTIDVGERYAEQAINLVVMDEVKDIVAARHKLPAEAVENIYMKHFKGEKLSDAEMEIVNDVNSFSEQVSQNYRSLSPEAMREAIEEQYGVNVDEALRKTEQGRSATENEAVKEYASMLYQQAERQRKANSIFNAQYNEMRAEHKENLRRAWKMQMEGKLLGFDPEVQAEADRAYEESHRVYDRFEQGDPTAQADIDAIGLRMQEAYQMCEDAFGAEAEYYMFRVNENPWALVNDPELTAEQQDAVLYYINSKAALDGVMDASHEASQRKREQVEQEVAGRTHKERGVIIPAVLKVDDKPAYIIKGDVVMYPDGSGVDVTKSSESIIIMDESGEYKFVSPDQIYKVGESIDPQDELQTAYNQIDAEQQSVFGVDVPPEPEAPSQPIVDTREYDRGYERGIEVSASLADDVLNDAITDLRGRERLTDAGRGMLEAYEYEQQRRAMEAQTTASGEEPSAATLSEGENDVTLQHGNRPEQNNDGLSAADHGGTVAGDAARGVEGDRDRSDIRVYEEGLGTSHDEYPEHSERNRREAESERLVKIARENGQYKSRSEIASLGKRYPKNTGESEVIIDYEHGRVYKIKDPYAKAAMKPGVNPEDAILEHLVHNKYFPETAYRFEGISDDLGDARIILSQGYVESVGQATPEQIEAALAEKGLTRIDRYHYGNDEVVVTDVTGDNALVGADGKVYFIDPIINFKRPVREIVGEMPEKEESAGIITEKRESGTESIPNADIPVENGQQERTPLERIPRDEKGEPVFEQAESPEVGWDALVEFSDGDAAAARENADLMVERKRKAYEKAQKLKPKGETPTEIRKSQKANAAQLAQAESEYNLWQRIAGVEQARKNAIRAEQEAEARRLAAERAEAERAERAAREEAERLEREALEGVPEWHMDTPENARKRGYRRVGAGIVYRNERIDENDPGLGKEVYPLVKSGDSPESVRARVFIGELDRFQASHADGRKNPAHFLDEAQPKRRHDDGGQSEHAAERNARNFRGSLIMRFEDIFSGAPLSNYMLEIIQGNGRKRMFEYLYERYPEKAAEWRQKLIDHADELGVAPDYIASLEKPFLDMVTDIDDAEAIRLGNIDDKAMTSGGTERIKAPNAVNSMGDEMATFANMLMRSNDEEATFHQLVERNGLETLKWMKRNGYITGTQYSSAVKNDGGLRPEATEDLRKIMYHTIFRGGASSIEEMFDKMPAKAQRAILSTAFRDFNSPGTERMTGELQQSIEAFNELSGYKEFAEARNYGDARRAVELWRQTYAFDEASGKPYLPAEKFSNFALVMAAMYKGSTQKKMIDTFNRIYELVQGTHKVDLHDMMVGKTEEDYRPRTLAESIREVLGIEYEPVKKNDNGRNGQNGSAVVDSHTETSQRGGPGGTGDDTDRERAEAGTEPSERGAGTSDDSAAGGATIQDNIPEKKEVTSADPRTMPDDEKARRGDMLRNAEAIPVEKGVIVSDGELSARKVAEAWWDANVGDPVFYETEAGEVEIAKSSIKDSLSHGYNQAKLDALTSLSEGFRNATYLGTLPDFGRPGVQNHYFAYPIFYDGQRRYVFCRAMATNNKNKLYVHEVFLEEAINKSNTLQTIASASKDGELHGGIALYRAILKNALESSNAKEVYNRHTTDKPIAESVEASQDSELSGTTESSRMNAPTSERKVTDSASEKQEKGTESSAETSDNKDGQTVQSAVEAASAEVNTEPTPAQAESENYKSVRALIHDVDQTPTNVNEGGMVVDVEGKALTLYHGTPNDVELSDLEMGHTRAGGDEAARYNGDGISFTPNRDVAEDYASDNGGQGKVFEVNVTLKKPYFTLGVANLSPEEAAKFTASLQAQGYDGIINYQSKAMREAGAIPNEVIVFDIKSATPVKGVDEASVKGEPEKPGKPEEPEKREKPWYGTESEMPATPGLKPRQRSAMFEASVEAFRDGQMAHNHLDVFGRSEEEFELPYNEFVSRYKEIVTEGTATATEKYLPEVFEYLKNRFNTALDKAEAPASEEVERDKYGNPLDDWLDPIVGNGYVDEATGKQMYETKKAKTFGEFMLGLHSEYNNDAFTGRDKALAFAKRSDSKQGERWSKDDEAIHEESVVYPISGFDVPNMERWTQQLGKDTFSIIDDEAGAYYEVQYIRPKSTSDPYKVRVVKASFNAPAPEKQADTSDTYTITPTTYTNKKGRTRDVWLVKFNRELTAEEKAAFDTFMRGQLTEGKKTSRGWYDHKQEGYMMRSEEAARQLGEMLGNEEAVADAQPLSREDIRNIVDSNYMSSWTEDEQDLPIAERSGFDEIAKRPTSEQLAEIANEYGDNLWEIYDYADEHEGKNEGDYIDSPYTFEDYNKMKSQTATYREILASHAPEMLAKIDERQAVKEELGWESAYEYYEILKKEGKDAAEKFKASLKARWEAEEEAERAEKARQEDARKAELSAFRDEVGAMDNRTLGNYVRRQEKKAYSQSELDKLRIAKAEQARRKADSTKKKKKPAPKPANTVTVEDIADESFNDDEVVDALVNHPMFKNMVDNNPDIDAAREMVKKVMDALRTSYRRDEAFGEKGVNTYLRLTRDTELQKRLEDVAFAKRKPYSPAEPKSEPAPKGQFKVTDEMKAQEEELRRLLGIDDDEGSTDSYFRDPEELTPEQMRKVFSLGVNYAFNFLDNGVTTFPDFAKAIVGRLGTKVKPFIKSWYEGAKRVPGYGGEGYTDTAEVDRFDIENFDKPSPDAIRDAEMRVAEHKAKQAAAQAEKELIAERNEQRKKDEQQTAADTAALASEAEAVASEGEATADSAKDERAVAEASEKVDNALDKISKQLAILGYFERKGNDPVANVERKAAEAGADLAARLTDELGLKLTDLPKGVNVASADFGEMGGYVRINLPVRSGYEPLRIDIRFARTGNESLRLTELTSTLKRGDEKSYIIGEDHKVWLYAPKYGELLETIKEQIGKYLPKEEFRSQASDARTNSTGQWSERGVRESLNGYKRGDEVMWDRYGNGKWEKVKIEDFDTDGSPIFESFKGVMSEKGDWSRVKPADGVFGEAKRVATKSQAERKKKEKQKHQSASSHKGQDLTTGSSTDISAKSSAKITISGKKPSSSYTEASTDKAAEVMTGGRVKKSRKKDVTLKADEPVGGLFANLFDEPETPKANEKRNGNKPSQEVAGGERAHTVGTDETGTDGRVPAAGTEPTDKGGAADEPSAGVERGTDGTTHGTDADGGLQPLLGDRGRDESNADSRSAGASVERGGTSGAGSVSKRGTDRGAEGLSEGEPASESGRGSGTASVKKPKKPEVRYTRNFRYDEKAGNEADSYTPKQRLEANVKAIETLADVLFGGKPATEEQRAIMSRFRGWGQVDLGKYYDIDHILRNTYSDTPINRLAKVIQKLDPQGDKKLFDAIKRASLSSYYTPTPIARAMNTFLGLAGYKGGALLDPSMGNGMYEGTLPKSIQERTAITGVELDWISGQLSRKLYPDANVMIGGFEKSGIAPGSFDVVTSNVPFGDIVVNDPTWKNDATPLKRSAQNRIHNYYAVKMLEAARPGGLVAMLTTSAVMDTPSNQNIRAHIADQGEILGAIRLPDNTFQGTGVVTDILLIRKWRDDQDRAQAREDASYIELENAFLSHYEATAPNKLDGKEEKVRLNGYFEKNPRNLIGEMQAGNQYGKRDAFGLTSKLSVEEIASEIEKAVRRIVGTRRGSLFNPSRTIRESQQAIREAYKGDGDWVSNGNLVIQDGKVGVLTAKSNEYGEVTREFEGTLKHDKMLPKIKAMTGLRTAMKKLIAGQIEGSDEANLTTLRGELQEAYDQFVGKYGRLQDKDNAFILDDIDGYTLQALETWKNGKFTGLSDIFTKNSIKPALKLDGKKTPQEAVALSLAEYGYLRPDYLAKALGEDWAEQCGDFVFLKPNSEDDYVTRDEYLSGDVVTKLAEAKAAAEKEEAFKRNVKALEEVQPARIPFDDIAIHLGARWIPENVLNDFVNNIFGIHAVRSNRNGHWDPEKKEYVYNQKSGVRYIPETDSFEINIEKKELGGAASDWETPKKSAKEILQAALEDKTLLIKYKDKEGNEHIDEEQTELANQKIADLRERFESWLPSDPERVDLLEQTYNDRFNRTVIRHFDGTHLVVPGLMGKELRPHQKDAVWMLINNRGGIVDHIVGAGKTLVMQSAIMEMRRMGIAKKPMIVALKSTVAQIAREFKEAFPSARVLAPNDSDFKKGNRKKFIANISLNDYDCVILSHEQYCMLPHTEEAERAVIDEQMWQLDNMIEYLYGTNDSSQMTQKQIKALEKRRENLKARLEKRLDRNVDREFCFENLGIDYMFVDESHQFKSLPYVTSYQKVAGLGDAKGSSRAVALLTGIRHLQRMHQGDKGTVFLSGTTITNSLVEIYNLLNYLRPRKLEELGMPTFDAWASVFAVHSAELEAGVTGNFAMKDRFRSFDNVPELSQLYAEIADVRNDTNLKLPKPAVDGRTVIVPASESMQEINSEIVNMLESKNGSYFEIYPKDPNRAPWGFHASTLSAKAAVSPRLIFPDMEDAGGKVHAVCENVKKYYDEQADQLGVQLIFCEIGVPDKSKRYDAYTDMMNRFVNDYGIPRSEIAYIQEANTEEKRKDLFQRVRDGKVRILIGGTKNMGTGVNVQDRITDMHMLTVPWTPSALEQCIGRGARQGNLVARDFMDNKVRVHYYATEGSLDLYKYQLLDAKGKMFTQFKMGTVNGGRSFDEGSADEDGNIDPAEMVAILSGNPVIFERAKQEKVVKKLRALRNGFERDYQRKKAKHAELQRRKENFVRLIRLNDRDRADLEREGFKPDDKGIYPTTVTITEGYSRYGGRTFDKPKEAGEYLLKMLEEGKNVTLQGFGQRAQVVTVNEEGSGGLFSTRRELQIGTGEHDIKYTIRLSDDATAAGTAFRNLLKRIVDNGAVYRHELEAAQNQLAGMNIGDGVFPRQAELDEAVAKLKELNAEYNKLGKTSDSEEGDKSMLRDGDDMTDGERLLAIHSLKPIEVERNELSKAELFAEYRGLPDVEKDGDIVQFLRTAFGKNYKEGGLFAQVVPQLDNLLETSVLAYSEKDSLGGTHRPDGTEHKAHPNVIRFDNYVNKALVGGKEYYVRMTVQKTRDNTTGLHSCFVSNVDVYEKPAKEGTDSAILRRPNDFYDGIVDAKLQQFFERASSELRENEMVERVKGMSERMNTPVRILRTPEEIEAYARNPREAKAKGISRIEHGGSRVEEIAILLPNNTDLADVENTFLHEGMGHDGLRLLFPTEKLLNNALDELYNASNDAIKADIDARAKRMYDAEVDRIFREKQSARESVADANSKYYTDMAEAHAEANAKREQMKRDATEEYGANVAGKVGEKGFEKMTAEEQTFWGKMKALLQQAFENLLRGLKIPKMRKWTDKQWAYIYHKAYKMKKAKGKMSVIEEAEDITARRRAGFDAGSSVTWKEKAQALTDTKKPIQEETYSAPKDSRMPHQKDAALDSRSESDDAKVNKICESLKRLEKNIPDEGMGKSQMVYQIASALGIRNASSSKSNYVVVTISGQGKTTFRISNHSAEVNNFGRETNNVGIVVKTSRHRFHGSGDVDYVEFMYYGDKAEGNAGLQRQIVRGLRHYIETGDFGQMPEPDRLNTSGAYRRAVEGIGEKIMFRDSDLGLEEYITKMKTEAMQANADNLQAKRDAMRAIGGNLNHLRQAMARQREYDITTVKSVTDLAKILMDAGLLDDMSKFETKRILGAVSNVVGKQDASQYVQKVMDIMVDNQLRNTERALGKLISMRTSRADGRGINVQGALDPDGEAILKIFNAWKGLSVDEIDRRIADATDSMSDPYAPIADRAALEYAGLQIARDYAENVAESKKSEKTLREEIKKAKEEKDAGRMTADAYKQTETAIRAAIQQMKLDRISAYESLMEKLGGELKESVARAKAWREAEKERVNAIHHLANSDMQGRELRGDREDTRLMKLRNNWLVNWLLEPMSTLDQMLKMFGSKNPNGEGYMQNHFMRGWIDAADREQEMKEAVHKQMDEKAAEIFGKRRTWHNGGTRKVDYTYSDIYDYAKAQPGATIEYYDGAEMREYEIEQGKLLYLYAVDKMPMGRATNRRMGIDDVTMQRITDALDPKLKAYADWVQDELLPRMGDSANEVHKKMFGADMDAIDNYFPFVRDKDALKREVENGQTSQPNDRISVQTGAIKKRVASVAKWDMRKCNFMDVLAKHVDEMCHWTSFAELNRDFGTLLSYNRLKQQVFRMNSVYGAGEQLWKRFEECAAIATDAYEPQRAKFDRFMVQGAKGVTMGKITFRTLTALKQTLSLPAFFGEVNLKYVAADLGTGGVKACQWAWRNMPNFRKRILSRTSGDYRLKENEYDGKIMKAASYGMLPNIGVDAWTIAVGSHGVYKTRKAKYLRWGMDESKAEHRAIQDAELCYNKSQQSSEGPFMAPVQVDHTFYATSAMLFRNSSTSYTREAYTSARNLKRLISGEVNEEFVTKQILRTLHPEAEGAWTDAEWANARKNAKKEIRSAYVKNTVNLAMFGWILPWLWRIGGIAPLLLLSGDEEEKQKQLEDTMRQSRFAPVEGLAYGDVVSDGLNMLTGANEKSIHMLGRSNPMLSDIMQAAEQADKDMLAAANDVINIIGGMAFGVNPQTLTDAVVAVMDYCGDDAQTSRECALLMARVLNCPQSQLDKIYFDELDASGEEASRMTPSQIAERYARYQIRRGAPLTGWAYGSKEREKIMEKYRKRSNTIAKERLARDTDKAVTDSLKTWNDEYKATKDSVSEIEKFKERDADRYYELLDALEATPEFERYQIFKDYKSDVDELTKEWLRATTPEQRDSCAKAMINLKRLMVTELRDTAQ